MRTPGGLEGYFWLGSPILKQKVLLGPRVYAELVGLHPAMLDGEAQILEMELGAWLMQHLSSSFLSWLQVCGSLQEWILQLWTSVVNSVFTLSWQNLACRMKSELSGCNCLISRDPRALHFLFSSFLGPEKDQTFNYPGPSISASSSISLNIPRVLLLCLAAYTKGVAFFFPTLSEPPSLPAPLQSNRILFLSHTKHSSRTHVPGIVLLDPLGKVD